MDWSNERYVRLYTRDTIDWCLWPWQARAVFPLLLRKMDRSGFLAVGNHGAAGIAELVRMPVDVVQVGLDSLVRDGCVTLRDGVVTMKNYVEAQESKASDALRAKNYRERAKLSSPVTPRDEPVTKRDVSVTDRHAPSQTVTPSLAVPSLAVPVFPASRAATDSQRVESKREPKPVNATKYTNPRHQETVDLLVRTWQSVVGSAYQFQGPRDGAAVARLLTFPDATHAEIERRFRVYLADPFSVRQASLAHFASKWSGCVQAAQQRPAQEQRPTTRKLTTQADFDNLYKVRE